MVDTKGSNATKDEATNEDVSTTENVQAAIPYHFSRDDAVTLVVGPEEKEMFVHGTYMTKGSDFFKAALKKEWTEGHTRVIKLPEQTPEIMAHFLTFVYHGQLPFNGILPTKKEHFTPRWPILIELYLYGERFLCPSIQNAVIDEILRLTRIACAGGKRWYPTHTNVDKIYRGTPEGSPLRRLMVDMHLVWGRKNWLSETTNAQFLLDVAKAFYDKINPHTVIGDFRLKELVNEDYLGET